MSATESCVARSSRSPCILKGEERQEGWVHSGRTTPKRWEGVADWEEIRLSYPMFPVPIRPAVPAAPRHPDASLLVSRGSEL